MKKTLTFDTHLHVKMTQQMRDEIEEWAPVMGYDSSSAYIRNIIQFEIDKNKWFENGCPDDGL